MTDKVSPRRGALEEIVQGGAAVWNPFGVRGQDEFVGDDGRE